MIFATTFEHKCEEEGEKERNRQTVEFRHGEWSIHTVADANFCPWCGVKLPVEPVSDQKLSRRKERRIKK